MFDPEEFAKILHTVSDDEDYEMEEVVEVFFEGDPILFGIVQEHHQLEENVAYYGFVVFVDADIWEDEQDVVHGTHSGELEALGYDMPPYMIEPEPNFWLIMEDIPMSQVIADLETIGFIYSADVTQKLLDLSLGDMDDTESSDSDE